MVIIVMVLKGTISLPANGQMHLYAIIRKLEHLLCCEKHMLRQDNIKIVLLPNQARVVGVKKTLSNLHLQLC